MKNFYLILVSIFTIISCKNNFSKGPSEETMKSCLSHYFSDKIKINSYQHIDGLQRESEGVKYYDSYFNAEIKFISNYNNFIAGDEYKIIKGVLSFMKTENGWNCQEFDFSESELVKINKFETSHTNSITKSFKNQNSENKEKQIKDIINNYYDAISNKDFDEFYNLFSTNVNFFGNSGYSVNEIITNNKKYQEKWPFSEVNIDENSFEIENSGDNTIVKYRMFYKVKKMRKDNWKIFDLKMKIILNQDLRIESINEYRQ